MQGHVCPRAEEGSTAAAYFVTIKSAVGQHLSGLELPDDLVSLFTSLRDSVINQCTSAPAESEGEGADASSAMGLYLRMCYARYTAMPFEVGGTLLAGAASALDPRGRSYDKRAGGQAGGQLVALCACPLLLHG